MSQKKPRPYPKSWVNGMKPDRRTRASDLEHTHSDLACPACGTDSTVGCLKPAR